MFTGIIEEIGTVRSIKKTAHSALLAIHAPHILEDVKEGDSIAVNGICLTVTSFTASEFTVDVMPETMSRSSLGRLHSGAQVNIERALAANGRFGGHMVTGHIDGVGVIRSIRPDENAIWYTLRTTPEILSGIVEKGSIAIDGISLTVATVSSTDFSVSIIPHTVKHTTLSQRRVGDTLNLENDCIGKYIKKYLGLSPKPLDELKASLTGVH